jgi:hypothetical protein
MQNTALPMYMGYTGSLALDEMDKFKKEQDIENARIAAEQAEFDARINKGRESAIAAMQANPYMYAEGGEIPRSGLGGFMSSNIPNVIKSIVEKSKQASAQEPFEALGIKSFSFRPMIQNIIQKAKDSNSEPENPYIGLSFNRMFDGIKSLINDPKVTEQKAIDSAQSFGFNPSRIQNSSMIPLYAKMINAGKDDNEKLAYSALVNNPFQYADGGEISTYAAGGQPRYLSGGGDGMSDSIPATINGNQPARLADGEFVIPADVVSHLGNGSSKAGAKQLYSMMDKVRSARTGTKKQGRQINPNKFLPA